MVVETAFASTMSLVIGSMMTAIGYLFRENRILAARERDCQRDMAQMRMDVLSLNALVEQMRWSGPQTIDALIVANMLSGLIVEWSPGATLLFQWTAREMLGKPIHKIMPERFRHGHDEAITSLKYGNLTPRRGPILTHALAKNGDEFPVTIFLSGWKDGSIPMVAATISRRLETVSDGASPNS